MGEPTGERRVPGLGALTGAQRSAAVARADAILSASTLPVGRLVSVLAMAVDAPVALASLIAEPRRQTLIGCHGLPDASAGHTGPARYGLCLHVVRTGMPIIVVDAGTDVRIRERAGTHDEEAAGYVGYPLRGPERDVVGSLCVVDRRPREWSGRELALVDHTAELINAVLADDGGGQARHEADVSQAFLAALLDSLDTGVAACDAEGHLVVLNRAVRRYAVTDPDNAPPEQWGGDFDTCHPDGRPYATAEMPLLRALEGEQVRGVEQIIGPPDRRRHVLVNGHPIIDADGHRLGAVCAVHDITERRRAQRLRQCDTDVCYALTAAPDIASAAHALLEVVGAGLGFVHGELWLPDRAGTVMTCAAQWTTPEHGIEVRVPERIAKGRGLAGTAWQSGEPVWQPDNGAEGGPVSRETAASGRVRAALALPVRNGDQTDGVLTFFSATEQEPDDPILGLLSGIAAHLARYLEHRRAEELALALARSKDEYVALVGHEVRTPLTAISTYTELMLDNRDEASLHELRPLLEVVERNATRLRAIVDDLLELAALDSGEAIFNEQPVDLAALVDEALKQVTSAAGLQRLGVDVDLPATLVISGDSGRLRQVLDNLLDNAVKYSPDGGRLSIAARREGDVAILTITDPGIGIPDDEYEQVFRRFRHSSRTDHQGIPGTGLGLPLSRAIAERHQGTLRLVAAPSGGTTAILTLPVRAGDSAAAEQVSGSAGR